ncbi:MAG TPA: hypothetical protein HA362_01535 [Nanoarchaeota archaeon]|nr:hypothetical protein [Nanoarchaeota archaeon]
MVFENIDFADLIKTLEQMGFYQVVLPFMLIFTIMFAILQKIKLFGDKTKNINVVIAVIIAFFVVRVPVIITTINEFLPKVSMLVLILLMFLLIIGIFGIGPTGWSGAPFLLAMAGAVFGIVWAVSSSIPGFSASLPSWFRLTSQDKAILLAVGIFVLLLWVFKEKKDNEPSAYEKFKTEFGPGMFGAGGGGKAK